MKNDVKQNEVTMNDIYKKLENYILQAPFDGIVTKIDIFPGDRLNADTQKFISVVDPDTIEIISSINQTDIIKVKKGMLAKMTLDAYPEKTFTGTITEVETTPKEEGGISRFETKIILKNPEKLKLFSGMKVLIKIAIKNIPEGLVIPFTSVMSDESAEKYVTVVANGISEKRYIEVGYTDGEFYQVISGLDEGENIYEIDYDSSQFKEETFN